MALYIIYLIILCIGDCRKEDHTSVDTGTQLLLIGSPDAGASTLFETFKLVPNDHNLDLLLREGRSAIRQNCVSGILTLLQQSQDLYDQDTQHNKECLVSLSDDVVNAINLIVHYKSESFTHHLGHNESQELCKAIYKIWRLDSIQATFLLRDTKYRFPVNVDYFFDKIKEIMMEDYIPTKEDALKCKMPKSRSIEHTYTYKEKEYKVIDSSALSNERRKWIHQFDTSDAILFVAALDNYNTISSEDALGNTHNAMHEAIASYAICNSKWLKNPEVILFLNRDDLFREKLRQQISLSVCFSASVGWKGTEWDGPDYTPIVDYDYDDKQHYDECYAAAITFIGNAFLEIRTTRYYHVISATDNQMDEVFDAIQHMLIGKGLASVAIY
eukprot:72804_1